MLDTLGKLLVLVIAGAFFWYGPFHAEPPAAETLRVNEETMARCKHAEAFAIGSGRDAHDPEAACAMRHGLYRRDDGWYSVDQPAPVRHHGS